METLGAAMRLFNTVGSAVSLPQNAPFLHNGVNPNFDPLKYIPEEKKIYASKYAFANSPAEVEAITQRIDQEEKDRQTMAASGWLGGLAGVGAGIVDPVMYVIPGLGPIKKYQGLKSILANGATHALYGAGAMTLQSALLHQTQVTRTFGESAMDVAGGAFLGGLIGGIGGGFGTALAKTGKPLSTIADQLEKELVLPQTGRYTSAEIQKVEQAYQHTQSALEALKNSGVSSESSEMIQATLKAKTTADTLEKMKEDVFHKDPLEPGFFEIPESAVQADTAHGSATNETEKAIQAQIAPEQAKPLVNSDIQPADAPTKTPMAPQPAEPVIKDYLNLENWDTPKPVEPTAKPVKRKDQLDELTALLGEMKQTATIDAGEMNVTDFLEKFDIPYQQTPDVGDGLGYRFRIPAGKWVYFKRGATLSQLDIPTRKLASMIGKGSNHEDVIAALREATSQVVDTASNHSEAGYYSGITGQNTEQVAKLDAQGRQQFAAHDAETMNHLKYINQKANEALHQLKTAQDAEAYSQAIDALDNPDFSIMPEEYWKDATEAMNEATARIDHQATAGGETSGQLGSAAGSADASPGAPGPAEGQHPADHPVDAGADHPNDPLAFERGAPADWETVYSSHQLELPGEELNAKTLDERLKDHSIIEKLPLFNKQDPLIRTQLSKSIETRRTVQRLVETPLKYEKNALGIGSEIPAEALARRYKAPLAFALKAMDDLFVEYRIGAAKLGGKALAMAEDVLGKTEGKLSFDEFKQAVGKAMRNGDQAEIPQVAQAAQRFRTMVFDPLKEKATALGLLSPGVETETAVSYLTRVWDAERIAAKRQEFFEINKEWLLQKEMEKPFGEQRSDAEIEDIVDQVIDRILGTPEGRLAYDVLGEEVGQGQNNLGSGGKKGLSKPLKARVYDIPDAWVEDFLVNDIEHAAKIYERSLASDTALVERFGSVDMEAEIQAIRRDYAEKARAAASEQEARSLKGAMDSDIRDIAAMRDRIRGIYGLPADPSSTFVRAGKMMRAFNFLSLMGGVTLSSLADIARPMMVHGLQRYITDGLVPLVTNFKAFRASAEEVKLAGTALDMILESRAAGIGELMDDYGRGSKFERLLHGTASLYGKGTGLSQWTATLKQWSGMMTQSRIIQAALDAKAGTISKKELTNLAASYIDPEMAIRVANEFEKYGEKNGSVMLPNTVYWTDREAVKAFRAGLAKEVDKIIVTPGIGDKPLWLSSEWGKLFGQFKSFFISATQRVLVSGLQDRDLAVLNGSVFATSLGVLTTLLQAKLSGRKLSMRPQDLILEGIDRAGLMGWLFEMNGSVEKLTRGHFGLSALTGKEPMSRFQSRNVIDSLLGPSAGRVQDFARVTGAATSNEWTAGDVRAMRRLLPFQNLFYLRTVFDKAEDGVRHALNVEDADAAKTE